jgi:hypothetical protein
MEFNIVLCIIIIVTEVQCRFAEPRAIFYTTSDLVYFPMYTSIAEIGGGLWEIIY